MKLKMFSLFQLDFICIHLKIGLNPVSEIPAS
jgi:hypothetical protein